MLINHSGAVLTGAQDYVPSPNLSRERATVELLLKRAPAVGPNTASLCVLETFIRDPELHAIPVVADGSPVGLINRRVMIELYSKPYTRELFGKDAIAQFMDRRPVIVDLRTGIDEAAQLLINAGRRYVYDGFIITDNGVYAGMGTVYDLLQAITQRKQAHLSYLAYHDALTGLPNRQSLIERLQQACSRAQRNGRMVAMLFLDLDRFKLINDTFGHAAGDRLLKSVADRLAACVRGADTVARLGGDEFTVVLEDIVAGQDAATVAQKILDTLAQPFSLVQQEVFISASIGIALYPSDDNGIDSLFKKTDAAMYYAKEQGRNNYQFYSAEMNASLARKLHMENNLRRALEREELRLHYQPQVDTVSERIVGMEALLRWQHPEMGLVPPAQFIPLAEETGLIMPIGECTLRAACLQTRRWHERGFGPLRVAVNLSAHQFKQKDFPRTVARILGETGLDPGCLELELTESTVMDDVDQAIEILHALNAMGVYLSIDDFGTGYSSLSYLKRLPIDALKIDRSFVRDIGADSDDAAIVTAIIAMAHSLKLKVIAEGVETREQFAFLRKCRCDAMQGYYFSRPVPPEEFAQLLQAGSQMATR